MKNKLKKEQEELDISISVEELINRLKKLPKGSRVVIEQTGYYTESDYGIIYEFPEKLEDSVTDLYSIGIGGSSAYCY